MSKPNTTQKLASTISQPSSKGKKPELTQEQKEFLADMGYIFQKYNVPKIAGLLGRSKQNAQYYIEKKQI